MNCDITRVRVTYGFSQVILGLGVFDFVLRRSVKDSHGLAFVVVSFYVNKGRILSLTMENTV